MTQMQQQIVPSDSSSSAEIFAEQVHPDHLWDIAPRLWPFVKKATDVSEFVSPEHIFRQAQENAVQLWVIYQYPPEELDILAVVVTQIVRYDEASVCEILLAGGREMKKWTPLLTELEAWAKREGCSRIHVNGRPGWARVFPEYREVYRVFAKEI